MGSKRRLPPPRAVGIPSHQSIPPLPFPPTLNQPSQFSQPPPSTTQQQQNKNPGFRDRAELLESTFQRMGVLAALRSRSLGGATIGTCMCVCAVVKCVGGCCCEMCGCGCMWVCVYGV